VPLFREVAEQWFENQRDLRPGTLAQYRLHLDKYLLSAFGGRRFSEIDVNVIEAQRNRRLEEKNTRCPGGHLAPQSVNKLLTTLSTIFEFARKRKRTVGNVARTVLSGSWTPFGHQKASEVESGAVSG
jgi:hypothetical protein